MRKLWSILCICAMVLGMLPAMALSASAYRSIADGFYYECKTDGTLSIERYYTSVTDLTIPSTLDGRTVTGVDDKAFQDCTQLESVTFPNTLTTLGANAFAGCTSLKSVTIPDSVQVFGANVFDGCTSLESVKLPSKVSIMGSYVFADCTSLKSVRVPFIEGYFGTGIFYHCTALENVTFVGGRDLLMDNMFSYCSALKKITIPKGVTTVGVAVFFACSSLTSVIIPESVERFQEGAFNSCSSLKNVFYRGTKSQWEEIDRYPYNAELFSQSVHYNYAEPKIIDASATASYANHNAYASAKVTAKGTDLTYTWYAKDPGDDRYFQSRITSNTYKAQMTPTTSGRLAYCVVKDKYGNKVQSKTFVLCRKATITKEPATAAYAKKGATVSVKIGAAGDGLKYTWYIKNANGTKYSKSSITSATYSAKMSSTVKGRRVYCVVKDKYGKTVQSKTFLLREAVSITTQPKTAYAKSGAKVSTSVKASGDGLAYTWYIKNAGKTSYSKSSVTKSTYSVTMSSKSKDRLVYCVVKDKYGKTVKSNTVQLKMK